jgi:fimbrial isopeptide formation D2 family protein
VEYTSFTGTASESDIVVTYQAFVPEFDADTTVIIDPLSGDDVSVLNESSVSGDFGVLPVSHGTDSPTGVLDSDGSDWNLVAKSIAIQKGQTHIDANAVTGVNAGDKLEYTLSFQISDFFEFDDIVIDDVLDDGLRLDNTFAPTMSVFENGITLSAAINAANFTETINVGTDGTSDIQFRVSDELVTRGQNTILTGDLFAEAIQSGGTVGTIVFRAVIQDEFTDTFPSGDESVDAGDILFNNVTISGELPSTQTEADTGSVWIEIDGTNVVKSIYAIDGNTGFTETEVIPGHNITYRLKLELPSADFENLVLDDYLPLPVFDSTTLATFDNTVGATPPVVGTVTYGPDHTLETVAPSTDPPTLTTDANSNSVSVDFGTFDVNPSEAATVDILFTLEVIDEAFVDGLFLTNIALGTHGSTNQPATFADASIGVTVRTPILTVTKGVVASDANSPVFSPGTVGPVAFAQPGLDPGVTPSFAGGIDSTNLTATPIDSNMTGGDSDDLVKFAIVLENTGGADAFDVLITDTAPTDFQIPTGPEGLNLEVRDGDGNLLTFTGAAADIFTTGITIDDNGANGAINNFDDAQIAVDGSNIIVVTYDLEISTNIDPDITITNTASLDEYAASEGGADFTIGTTGDWTNDATVTTEEPAVVKDLVDTSIVNVANSNSEVVIGEIVQYQVTVDVIEGTTEQADVFDTLDIGLEFVSLDTIEAFSGGIATGDVTSTIGAFASTVLFDPTVVNDGEAAAQQLTFDLGDLTNTNTTNANVETVVLTYTARVMNITANQGEGAGTSLDNSAIFRWDLDGSARQTSAATAAPVTVIEADLEVLKTVDVSDGDAADTVTYTITAQHTGTSDTDAKDITFADIVPAEISFDFASGVTITRDAPNDIKASFEKSGNTLQTIGGSSFDLDQGSTVTITIVGTLVTAVEPNEVISNQASMDWTSLDGTDANERTGADGGGGLNNYVDSSPVASLTIDSPTISKDLVSTSVVTANNANDEAVIGETVEYQVTIDMIEGTTQLAEQ